VTEHRATPIIQVELGARPDAELRFQDGDAAVRAKAGFVDDDALTSRTDCHGSISIYALWPVCAPVLKCVKQIRGARAHCAFR
jgi:hypothetical protein